MRKVPFYSQFSIREGEWQLRSCGIAGLKMILEFWYPNESPTIDELLSQGLADDSFIENIGWKHKGLVSIAKKFKKVEGYNKDLASLEIDEAWKIFISDLSKFPLIVSVKSQFDPKRKDGHLVVALGVENSQVHILDPKEKHINTSEKVFKEEDFKKFWKKRYIAIFPQNANFMV